MYIVCVPIVAMGTNTAPVYVSMYRCSIHEKQCQSSAIDASSKYLKQPSVFQIFVCVCVMHVVSVIIQECYSLVQSEYADLKSLRSRLDDAVNTMIRREETEEDGVYIAPCIEGSLFS